MSLSELISCTLTLSERQTAAPRGAKQEVNVEVTFGLLSAHFHSFFVLHQTPGGGGDSEVVSSFPLLHERGGGPCRGHNDQKSKHFPPRPQIKSASEVWE